MIQGVGLILVNRTGHILVVKELVAKPHIKKEAGMHSFPLETMLSCEEATTAVCRLIAEELGDAIQVDDLCQFGVFPIVDTIINGFVANCENRIDDFRPRSHDVQIYGWVDPQELLHMFIRRETRPILEEYFLLQSIGALSG